MRRPLTIWLLFTLTAAALLTAAIAGPPVVLRWDLGARASTLSAAETATAVNQIRSAVVQGLGAVLVLVGAYVAWRQLQHSVTASQSQIDLQRRGNVTDRYTRAVEQLASADQPIRVGAIHALNRIADEAASERPGVIALLSSYVCPPPPPAPSTCRCGRGCRTCRRRSRR